MAIDTPSTLTTSYWHPFADMGAVSHAELLIERGEGVHVFDADGKRYLDGTASLWYANLGHGRPDVTRAVAAQMDRLPAYSTFGDFANAPSNELAARLAALAPMDDAKVFLASGGGDAIDTAAKIARRHWIVPGPARARPHHQPHQRLPRHPRVRHVDRRDRGEHANWGPMIPHTSAVRVRLAARARAGDPARRARARRRVLLRAGDRRRRRATRRPRATSRASRTCARSTASCS